MMNGICTDLAAVMIFTPPNNNLLFSNADDENLQLIVYKKY